jgi:hypothetical protein
VPGLLEFNDTMTCKEESTRREKDVCAEKQCVLSELEFNIISPAINFRLVSIHRLVANSVVIHYGE